jgi:hypothetical protein
MASLYCERDGKEYEAWTKTEDETMRQAGESELIVLGTLTSGPWRCDKCNAKLNRGDKALFSAIFPKEVTERLVRYDFSYEKEYFALDGSDKLTLYGARWPGGSLEVRLRECGLR